MSAWGGISIVNAIPSGLGSAAAIDMKTRIRIRSCGDATTNTSRLVETIINYFTARYGLPKVCVEIESDVPMGSGLKSSSSVAVALIDALRRHFSLEELDVPRLAAELSRIAGVSITGALDDAAAAYYGGIVFTDNTNMKILRVVDNKSELATAILLPRNVRRPQIDVERLRRFSHIFVEAYNIAMQGEILKAMTINGLAIARLLNYPEDIPRKALELGALAAGVSGNGPAIFAVCRLGDEGPVLDFFGRYGEVYMHRFVRLGEKP